VRRGAQLVKRMSNVDTNNLFSEATNLILYIKKRKKKKTWFYQKVLLKLISSKCLSFFLLATLDFLNLCFSFEWRIVVLRVEKSNVLMILHDQSERDCMYFRIFQNPHLNHTTPPEASFTVTLKAAFDHCRNVHWMVL
jgi:hypothetical protein